MIIKKMAIYAFLILLFSFQSSFGSQELMLLDNIVKAGDYSTIQKAIDALPPEGGTVFIPAGIYKMTEPIIVNKSEVSLIGAGTGTILLNTSEDGKNTIELKGTEDKPIWRVKVSDMHMKGNEKCGNGIYANHVNEISLSDMWIDYHGKSGIYLDYCYENPRVYDNNLAYNKEMGVLLDGCHDIVVSANQMEENGIGIYGKGLYNATVTGNNIDDHIKNCIYFVNTLGSIITANMLENCLEKSVILDEKCDGIVVTGNTFRMPGVLSVIKTKGVVITGNAFDCSESTALEVKESTLITVSGNIFSGSGEDVDRVYGMVMSNVNNVSISGNTIVKPLEGGIYILGDKNGYINITGNTIKSPSYKNPGIYSGILVQNTMRSIISNNIVVDDLKTKNMKSAIEEKGNSDYNKITDNSVNKGTTGSIVTKGNNTKKESNIIH
ncbi:NosD domain-containing protein [candidate division KSB1 bacterium]